MSEDKQNTQDTRSEVERMWNAMAAKFGVRRKWHDLHPMEQMQLVQICNILLQMMHD